jgi:hypothetical protein
VVGVLLPYDQGSLCSIYQLDTIENYITFGGPATFAQDCKISSCKEMNALQRCLIQVFPSYKLQIAQKVSISLEHRSLE